MSALLLFYSWSSTLPICIIVCLYSNSFYYYFYELLISIISASFFSQFSNLHPTELSSQIVSGIRSILCYPLSFFCCCNCHLYVLLISTVYSNLFLIPTYFIFYVLFPYKWFVSYFKRFLLPTLLFIANCHSLSGRPPLWQLHLHISTFKASVSQDFLAIFFHESKL